MRDITRVYVARNCRLATIARFTARLHITRSLDSVVSDGAFFERVPYCAVSSAQHRNAAGLPARCGESQRMAAYAIAHYDRIDDQQALDAYRELAASSLQAFGGRYLVRGDCFKEALEGDWAPRVLIIIEFADVATAKAWYHSDVYTAALAIRKTAGPRAFTIVDGAPVA